MVVLRFPHLVGGILAGGIAGAGTMKVLDRYWRQEMGEAPMSTGARGELRYGTPQSSHEVVVREGYSMR